MDQEFKYSALSQNKPTIAFLTTVRTGEWNLLSWHGIINEARKKNIRVLLIGSNTINSKELFDTQANILYNLANERRIQGIIVSHAILRTQNRPVDYENVLKSMKNIPIVTISVKIGSYPCITTDRYSGICQLVEHLIEKHKCRKMLLITKINKLNTELRIKAYKDTLKKYNIPIDENLIFIKDEKISKIDFLNKIKAIIQNGIDAIICGDAMAFDIVDLCKKERIHVPGDIKIVGIENLKKSQGLNPSLTASSLEFIKMGEYACSYMLNTINGNNQKEPILLKPKLYIRRSCGCHESNVSNIFNNISQQINVSNNPLIQNSKPYNNILYNDIQKFNDTNMQIQINEISPFFAKDYEQTIFTQEQKTQIINELHSKFNNLLLTEQLCTILINSLIYEVENQQNGIFSITLKGILAQSLETINDLSIIQNIIISLNNKISELIWSKTELYKKIQKIIDKTFVDLCNYINQIVSEDTIEKSYHFNRISGTNEIISTSFHLKQILNKLKKNVYGLGFLQFYLVLYENPRPYNFPDPIPEWSRLILAVKNGQCLDTGTELEGMLFQTKEILPDKFWWDEDLNDMIIYSLYFHENQLGYIVMQTEQIVFDVYFWLCNSISYSIQISREYQDLSNHSAELSRQKYIMDTFMESIPDSIYFKDKDGKIINANKAFLKRHNKQNLEEIIGLTNNDFYSEIYAKEVSAEESSIIETGKPIINQEENDTKGNWSLVTKMPLKDEHNKIMGTFAISCDITEMKNTQVKLVEAYNQINILHQQLKAENIRMASELDIAKRMQELIQPNVSNMIKFTGFQAIFYQNTKSSINENYFDIFTHNDNIFMPLTKRNNNQPDNNQLENSILMIMLQSSLGILIEHGIIDLKILYKTLNSILYENRKRMDVKTSFYLLLTHFTGNQICLIGSPLKQFIIRRDGKIESIYSNSQKHLIGVQNNQTEQLNKISCTISSDEYLVIFTDNQNETEKSKPIPDERILNTIINNRDKPVDQIKKKIAADTDDFFTNINPEHDFTLLLIKKT